MFVLTPNGHIMCNLSLFNCNKNTINTNKALAMKNAKTDLFRSSIRSEAMRAFSSTIDHLLRVGREREREKKRNWLVLLAMASITSWVDSS